MLYQKLKTYNNPYIYSRQNLLKGEILDKKGQFPLMNLLRVIIVVIGILLALSGVGDLTSGVPITDLSQQISRATGGWIKILVGIAFMLIGVSPQSIRMMFRV